MPRAGPASGAAAVKWCASSAAPRAPPASSASPTRRCSSARRRPVSRSYSARRTSSCAKRYVSRADDSSSIMPLRTASSSAPRTSAFSGARRRAGRRARTPSPRPRRAPAGRSSPAAAARAARRRPRARSPGVPSSASGAHEPQLAVDDLDDVRVHQRPPQLADQERVAGGQVADRPGELRDVRVRSGAPDEVGHVLAGEPGEAQAHDVVGAAQVGERLRQRVRHLGVAERRQQQQPRPPAARARWRSRPSVGASAQCASSSTSSTGRARLTPVSRSATAVCRRWRTVSGSVSARGAGSPRSGIRRASSPPVGPSAACSSAGLEHPGQPLERLDERAVRRADDRVARAVEHERAALGRLGRELAHEPALARPGLPADDRHPARGAGAVGSSARSVANSLSRPTNGNAEGRQSGPGRSALTVRR